MATKNAICEVCKKRYLRFYITPGTCGGKCQVVVKCSACGYIDDITDLVMQVSKQYIDDLLDGK